MVKGSKSDDIQVTALSEGMMMVMSTMIERRGKLKPRRKIKSSVLATLSQICQPYIHEMSGTRIRC